LSLFWQTKEVKASNQVVLVILVKILHQNIILIKYL